MEFVSVASETAASVSPRCRAIRARTNLLKIRPTSIRFSSLSSCARTASSSAREISLASSARSAFSSNLQISRIEDAVEFLAAAFAEALFFGAEISDGAEFLAALPVPVELSASFTTAPLAARVFSAGGGTCVQATKNKPSAT